MTALGLRTVKRIIAKWEKDGEVQSYSGNSGKAKILNARDGLSLKRLLKGNRWKSVYQLTK